MKNHQFITAIEAAGFQVQGNRVSIKNDLNVNLENVLTTKGFIAKTVDNGRGKLFVEYSHLAANFTVNHKAQNPVFATVDLI